MIINFKILEIKVCVYDIKFYMFTEFNFEIILCYKTILLAFRPLIFQASSEKQLWSYGWLAIFIIKIVQVMKITDFHNQ
jgi:hypothetical protein